MSQGRLDHYDFAALERVARLSRIGGASFPTMMLHSMQRFQRMGLVEIITEGEQRWAKITETGKKAIDRRSAKS